MYFNETFLSPSNPCSFDKDLVRIAASSRRITQPKVEPSGAVGGSRVDIERYPASAGNAVVLGRRKHWESTVTLMHFSPQILNLSRKRKQQMPATVIWEGFWTAKSLCGTELVPSVFDVSATAQVAPSCRRLTALVVVAAEHSLAHTQKSGALLA